MRTTHMIRTAAAGLLLGGALLATGAGTAVADDATPSPSASDTSGTAETAAAPGTGFRTAGHIGQGVTSTPAGASTGDYLYWVTPAKAGEILTVSATVQLPESASRHGAQTWQLDLYDGLRRHQACTAGKPTVNAAADAATVELSCRLRTVRAWSEAWANDPLPGAYYIRLTVVRLADQDLGLPVQVQLGTASKDAGGSQAVDGELAAPLTPVAKAGATLDPNAQPSPAATEDSGDSEDSEGTADPSASPVAAGLAEPDGGWGGGWWSDRWLWTAGGGVLGALAGVAGYNLTRGRGRRPVA